MLSSFSAPIAAGPGDSIPRNTLACSFPRNTFWAPSRLLVPKPYLGMVLFSDRGCAPTLSVTLYCPAPGSFRARSMSTSFPLPPLGIVNPGSVWFLLSHCLPTPDSTLYAAGPGLSIPKNTFACSLPMNTFSA